MKSDNLDHLDSLHGPTTRVDDQGYQDDQPSHGRRGDHLHLSIEPCG